MRPNNDISIYIQSYGRKFSDGGSADHADITFSCNVTYTVSNKNTQANVHLSAISSVFPWKSASETVSKVGQVLTELRLKKSRAARQRKDANIGFL